MIYLLNIFVLLLGIGNVNSNSTIILETTVISAETELIKPCTNITVEEINNSDIIDNPSSSEKTSIVYTSAPSLLGCELTVGDCFDEGCMGRGEDCIVIVMPCGGGICYKWGNQAIPE